MKAFLEYAEQLDVLLDKVEWGNRFHLCDRDGVNSLNAGAAEVLHQLGDATAIRRSGAYFTGQQLADLALSPLTRRQTLLKRPIYDPTCGAGDLLLRWAGDLPISADLRETVERWEPLLRGHDIFPEFLGVAKRRLVLKAIVRGACLGGGRPLKMDRLFRRLREGDAQAERQHDQLMTLAMNPPFSMVLAADGCEWGSGKVSLAAVLFETCLKRAAAKTRLVAILPDVLRTGSRYGRWRNAISQRLRVERVQPYGRFDSHANIDVFIIEGVAGGGESGPIKWWTSDAAASSGKVGDHFAVSVGAVVPYRDPDKGPWAPFATSKTIPAWKTVKEVDAHRRFEGTKVLPPFVTVRRTSSPRDAERAIGSVVSSGEPVAVENHLLVLKPREGGLKRCEAILQSLKDPRTKAWLDDRIRCRHLTVGVLRELPIWEDRP
ncbi:MAG TPA: hypothetical protein VN578_01120 [Candidatus Binatia bacterium]|jgi:hypothetical protein|nr:hypothetical protein [Candidatus Binatia bacterium]